MINEKEMAHFDALTQSKHIAYVNTFGRHSSSNLYYDVRVHFKDDSYKDSPEPMHIKKIIANYGPLIAEHSFELLHHDFPELFDSNLLDKRNALQHKREMKWKAKFAAKMEALIPIKSIIKVELGQGCLQSSPCLHQVLFYLHGNDQPISSYDKSLSLYDMSSRHIANLYADLLNAFDFMHVRDFMDKETQDRLTPVKLAQITDDVNLDYVHVRRFKNSYFVTSSGLIPNLQIYNIQIHYKDGITLQLDCRNAKEIVKYFGIFLDKESFADDEIQQYITQEVITLRTAREEINCSSSIYAK